MHRRQGVAQSRFEWDAQNRLTCARTPDDRTVRFSYDALGRRRVKAVDGERTFFAWDGDALLSERFEDQPAREYVYYPGTFEPLALIDGDGKVYYYHNDVNGLPQELTKANGDIVWSAGYDALGRVENLPVDEIAQPLRFQGQYFDEETRLFYNRYRYFDPATCSFISQDPIGLAGGENVYAYAPNVWGWVDPLGLCPKSGPGSIGGGSSKLPSSIAENFLDGEAERIVLKEPMTLERFHGGSAWKIGRWASGDSFTSRRTVRQQLALK